MEVRVGRSMQEQPSTPATATAPPAPPPPMRRPRVREVSSRFMSPVSSSTSSSSSAGDLHQLTSSSPKHQHQHQTQRSISSQRQRRQLKMGECDENNRPAETARSLDSPFPFSHSHQQGGKSSKHQAKPLKENGHRLDTPTPMVVPPPSRSRVSLQRSLTASAAAKLLQSSGMSLSSSAQLSDDRETTTTQDCHRENPNASASLDLLPTVSSRNQSKFFNNSTASPLYRSLSSPLSSCDDSSLFRTTKGSEKVSLSLKNGSGLSLPPVPPNAKFQVDTKKPRKFSWHQGDVQSLKLLHNHYLQWRFANAKAEVNMQAQKTQAERSLYCLGLKISELYDSVLRKRIELQYLLRVKTLTTIVESQIPYLEDWSALEGDYSVSLSDASQALLNASLRLPLSANIRVDTKELGEALTSATKLMEGIAFHVGGFVPKAEEVEILMSELAKVTGGERGLIEEGGVLLSRTHASQIEECSLRGQLIQCHKTSSCKLQETLNRA